MIRSIIFASTNANKLEECRAILAPFGIEVNALSGVGAISETGSTFVENALLKARHTTDFANGIPVIADDSGLCVPALNGAPGVLSARYAGLDASSEENMLRLLEQMSHLEGEGRRAFFHATMVLLEHKNDPTPIVISERIDGYITKAPRGENGFGYDPIFYIEEHNKTMAEISPSLKNEISHRAKALKKLGALLTTS